MIHQYKLSGYNIVLDVYSGSVHAVDDVAYDAIALIDQGSTPAKPPPPSWSRNTVTAPTSPPLLRRRTIPGSDQERQDQS